MKINQACIDLVKKYEGLSLKPYLCPAGKATIGYGATFYPNGRRVTMQDKPITEAQATEMLVQMLASFALQVKSLLKVELNENQFGALVSFAYNVGIGNLKSSTLLKLVNANKPMAASQEFDKWTRAGGKILPGLVKRRYEERLLFIK